MLGQLLEIVKKAEKKDRQLQANALRTLRLVDRRMAVYVLSIWKNRKELSRVSDDFAAYGTSLCEVRRVDLSKSPLSTLAS